MQRLPWVILFCLSLGHGMAQDTSRYISRYPGFLLEKDNAKRQRVDLLRDTPTGIEVIPRSPRRRVPSFLLDSVRFVPAERISEFTLHRRGGKLRAWLIGTAVGGGFGLLAGSAHAKNTDGFTRVTAGGAIIVTDMALGMLIGGVIAIPFGGLKHRFPINGSISTYEHRRPGLQYLRMHRY